MFTLLGCGISPAIAALLLAVLPVTLQTSSGEKQSGQLRGFTDSAVRLETDGQTTEVPFDALTLLEAEEAEPRSGPDYQVLLVGGSRIAAQTVQMTDSGVTIEPRRQASLKLPAQQVRAVRFRRASPQTDPQWLGNLERESRGDTLVIRRPGDRLDPQQGIVLSIGEGVVGFDLDGTQVDAPIERLEGIILGGTNSVREEAEIQVVDVYGSRWLADAIEPGGEDEPLRLKLNSNLTHSIPLDQIRSIRWSSGVQWLATTEPAEETVSPYVATNLDPQLFNQFFSPDGSSEALLTLFGGSMVEYRIAPGFQRLAGSVRRAPGVDQSGNVRVVIELDEESVWSESLEDEQPKGFDLPINQARRLRIRIDSGDDGDLGDQVHLLRPRLLK